MVTESKQDARSEAKRNPDSNCSQDTKQAVRESVRGWQPLTDNRGGSCTSSRAFHTPRERRHGQVKKPGYNARMGVSGVREDVLAR